MPIASRRIMQSGNFGSPKFDLGGCVLYVDLWRPDKAGSPFKSSGVYGIPIHTCTVFGAVWGSQGRTFDGTDDNIDCGTSSVLNIATGAFTFLFWIKPDLSVDNRKIFCKGLYNTDGTYSWFYNDGTVGFSMNQSGAAQACESAAGALVTNVWHHIAMRRSGANGNVLVNLVSKATSTTLVSATTSTRNFYIGIYDSLSTPLKGAIGEIIAYPRYLSDSGVRQHQQATKWRYT